MFVSTSMGQGAGEPPMDKGKMREMMGAMFGPGHVDQLMRQTLQACWQMLPEGQRSIGELRQQMQRLLDRALNDFADDCRSFGIALPRDGGSSASGS